MKNLAFLFLFFCIAATASSQRIGIYASSAVHSSYANTETGAWATASGVSDPTVLSSMDALITSGKSHGWWSTKFAVYFHAAGDATKSMYNILNPVNSDAAYRITTNGTVTYSSTGATGDGSTGYLNTHFVPSSNGFTTTSGYMSLYVRSNVNEERFDMGCANNSSDAAATFLITRYDNTAFGQYGNGSYNNSSGSSNSSGYWAVNRDGGTSYLYKNGSSIHSLTETATLCTFPVGICTYIQNGAPNTFTTKQYSFSTIGSTLTATQASNEYTDVLTFLTAVSAN